MSDDTGEVADDVKKRINERVEKLFVKTSDGKLGAHVCIVCDRLLKPKEVCHLEVDSTYYIFKFRSNTPPGISIKHDPYHVQYRRRISC